MNENSDLLPNLLHEEFEMQMRGYSRRQVDEFVARRNNEIRDLEQRLGRSLDESEHLRREISAVRQQALAGKPAHEEVSERISQILKLADDEANAQRSKADDEIGKQRAEAQQESDRVRADAREQAERMLTAAQEQAERTIAAARTEADKTRTAARTEADRLTTDTRMKADQAMSGVKAEAKKILDEATARATAIHDGAERRLNLLSTRHAETVRRLSDILDGVQGLVSAEAARMSLEEEVNQSVAGSLAASPTESAEDEDGGKSPDNGGERSLAALAPPVPETTASGAGAPPMTDVPPLTGVPPRNAAYVTPVSGDDGTRVPSGRHMATGPEDPLGALDDPADPLPGRFAVGEDGLTLPPPPPPPMPRRMPPPAPENAQHGGGIPMPTGSPRHGPGIPLGPGMPGGPLSGNDGDGLDRDGMIDHNRLLGRVRDVLTDQDGPQDDGRSSHTGLIDPDEPTEGIRLVR